MKKLLVSLSLSLLSSVVMASSSNNSVACFNSNRIGKFPVTISSFGKVALIAFADQGCKMTQVKYNPNSDKYQGWLRFAPTKQDSRACEQLAGKMLGVSQIFNKPLSIYWLSMSPETLKGQKGFVQLGYENDLDPGAGPVAKTNFGCFPEVR